MNLEYLEHHPIFSIKEVYYVGCVSVYQWTVSNLKAFLLYIAYISAKREGSN